MANQVSNTVFGRQEIIGTDTHTNQPHLVVGAPNYQIPPPGVISRTVAILSSQTYHILHGLVEGLLGIANIAVGANIYKQCNLLQKSNLSMSESDKRFCAASFVNNFQSGVDGVLAMIRMFSSSYPDVSLPSEDNDSYRYDCRFSCFKLPLQIPNNILAWKLQSTIYLSLISGK